MNRFLIPLGAFVLLVGFLYVGLRLNPREVPSPLVGKPAPDFTLARLDSPSDQFSSVSMHGKVWMLNVWASWCVACREEHALLVDIARQGKYNIVGLDYKDQAADAKQWLQQFGNPYQLAIMDPDGRVGIDYGVYGVPETFIIDKLGVVRHKVIGPITPDIMTRTVAPMIAELERE
jgi:cytochrome c biogenesis protein CcmG/thiol:disulfide interchange protein DsbE